MNVRRTQINNSRFTLIITRSNENSITRFNFLSLHHKWSEEKTYGYSTLGKLKKVSEFIALCIRAILTENSINGKKSTTFEVELT